MAPPTRGPNFGPCCAYSPKGACGVALLASGRLRHAAISSLSVHAGRARTRCG
jgi:hypothetical protein